MTLRSSSKALRYNPETAHYKIFVICLARSIRRRAGQMTEFVTNTERNRYEKIMLSDIKGYEL